MKINQNRKTGYFKCKIRKTDKEKKKPKPENWNSDASTFSLNLQVTIRLIAINILYGEPPVNPTIEQCFSPNNTRQ